MISCEQLNPVFIVGMPRSGTTMVSNMLNASGEVFLGRETHFFSILSKWSENADIDLIEYYFDSEKNKYFKYYGYSIEDLNFFKSNFKKSVSYKNLLKLICQYESKKNGIERWGEKTPDHYLYIEQIKDFFPDAKIVIVERNPLDVFHSTLKVEWGIKNPLTFGKKYLNFKKTVDYAKNNESVFLIRYENLLKSPDNELKRLFDFCNLKYTESILERFFNIGNLNYDVKIEPWKANNNTKLNRSNINKWEKDIKNIQKYKFLAYYLKKATKLKNPNSNLLIYYSNYLVYWISEKVKNRINAIKG